MYLVIVLFIFTNCISSLSHKRSPDASKSYIISANVRGWGSFPLRLELRSADVGSVIDAHAADFSRDARYVRCRIELL